jgi:hypothetical protein
MPSFQYASDRRAGLERAVNMINSRRNSWKSNPPSEREIRFMSKLRDKGMSMTSISISSRSSSRCAKFADRIEGAKRGFMMKSNGQPPVVHIGFSEAPSESRFVCLS